MAQQFDLYRLATGTYVVVLQSDLLDEMKTRVVAPLLPASAVANRIARLNPSLMIGTDAYLLMPQLAATLTLAELGEKAGSLTLWRDEIQRAIDTLISGI